MRLRCWVMMSRVRVPLVQLCARIAGILAPLLGPRAKERLRPVRRLRAMGRLRPVRRPRAKGHLHIG